LLWCAKGGHSSLWNSFQSIVRCVTYMFRQEEFEAKSNETLSLTKELNSCHFRLTYIRV
jgi:hypothetical protein